jgi:hypothetical protein
LAKLKKASDIFKSLEDIIISGKDGNIIMELGNADNLIKMNNSYSFTINPESCDRDFSINFGVKNLKLLPSSDYHIQVKYNEERDSYRLVAKAETIDGLEFVLSVNS